MEFHGFSYIVRAELTFTPEESDILKQCSEAHYDLKCKAASWQGGIIFGIANRVSTDALVSEPVPCAYTSRDINLLLKVCEMSWPLDLPAGRSLALKLKDVFDQLQKEQTRQDG